MKSILFTTILLLTFVGQACTNKLTVDASKGQAKAADGVGALSTSGTSATGFTITWTSASTNSSDSGNKQYRAYYSTSDNLSSVSDIEANGIPVADYAANIFSQTLTGLSPNTVYYFNVIVRSASGTKRAYIANHISTTSDSSSSTGGASSTSSPGPTNTAASDSTAPTAGNSGALSTGSITAGGLSLTWVAATDDTSAPANLEYRLYYSLSNNISTVAAIEANGTAVGAYTTAATGESATGLTSSTAYYFNVIVRDQAGNKTAYTTTSATTLADSTAPVAGGGGTLTTASITDSGLTINWTAATDDVSGAAALQYLLYYSASNNISTVANAETNGTAVGSYTANITTKAVTGLTPSTTYYFTLVVKDVAGNKTAYTTKSDATTADSTAPTAGNSGTLTTSSVGNTGFTINWTAASDSVTAAASLEYLAYYSTANNISTVANIESNGTAIGSYTANIATKAVTGLSPSTTYYFNVIVKDAAGNKRAYTSSSVSTTADVTVPTPGNSGTLSAASVTDTTLTVSWTAATDNVTAAANLEYLLYLSTSNNLGSVSAIESNGTAVGSYTANIATKNVTGLTASTTYYFNVIVRDAAGNKAAFSTLSQATTSGSAVSSPSNVIVSPGNGFTLIQWDTSATGVIIVRRTGAAVSWTPTDGVLPSTGAADANNTVVYVGNDGEYTDSTTNGTVYHYKVFAYDGSNVFSTGVTGSSTSSAPTWFHPSAVGENLAYSKGGCAGAINNLGNILIACSWWDTGTNAVAIFKYEYINGSWTVPSSSSDSLSPAAVDASYSISAPKVALNDKGEAAVIWTQKDGSGNANVYIAHKLSGTWNKPANLASSLSFSTGVPSIFTAIAIGNDGYVLAAWRHVASGNARIYRAEYIPGTGWSTPSGAANFVSGASVYDMTAPAVAVMSKNNAVMTWGRALPNGYIVRMDRTSGGWQAAQTISPDLTTDFTNTSVSFGDPAVTLAPNGEGLITFVAQAQDGDAMAMPNSYYFASRRTGGNWTSPAAAANALKSIMGTGTGFSSTSDSKINRYGTSIFGGYMDLMGANDNSLFENTIGSWNEPTNISTCEISSRAAKVALADDGAALFSCPTYSSEYRTLELERANNGTWNATTDLASAVFAATGETAYNVPSIGLNRVNRGFRVWSLASDGKTYVSLLK